MTNDVTQSPTHLLTYRELPVEPGEAAVHLGRLPRVRRHVRLAQRVRLHVGRGIHSDSIPSPNDYQQLFMIDG